MRCNQILLILMLTTICGVGKASVIASTDFSTGLEGWSTSPGSPAAFSWESAGGNPGGYIRYDDNLEGPGEAGSAIFAPTEYLGNWTTLGVTELSFQFNVFSTGNFAGVGTYGLVIEGGGGIAQWLGPTVDSATPWNLLTANIVESEWNVQAGTWDSILGSVTELRISMETHNSFSPAEITGIDNIALSVNPVPIPAAVWLFGTALIGFVGMSRRRKVA